MLFFFIKIIGNIWSWYLTKLMALFLIVQYEILFNYSLRPNIEVWNTHEYVFSDAISWLFIIFLKSKITYHFSNALNSIDTNWILSVKTNYPKHGHKVKGRLRVISVLGPMKDYSCLQENASVSDWLPVWLGTGPVQVLVNLQIFTQERWVISVW